MEPMNRSFKVFNTDGTKNGEVMWFVLLKVEINRYKEQINAVVTDLNDIDMFLEYDWLVKHNPEVNWNSGTMWFTRCPKTCRSKHQDISFSPKFRRTQTIDDNDKEQQEIGKELDPTNLEDLPDYIWHFTYLFNKKKFGRLLERQEWDHEINLTKETPKKLNAKAYAITIKEKEVLN